MLLDVVLPGMDGLTVCRLLKADPATAGVPLYMLTAKTRRADLEAALAAGANGYIHKPFRGSELIELVERLRTATRRKSAETPPAQTVANAIEDRSATPVRDLRGRGDGLLVPRRSDFRPATSWSLRAIAAGGEP